MIFQEEGYKSKLGRVNYYHIPIFILSDSSFFLE